MEYSFRDRIDLYLVLCLRNDTDNNDTLERIMSVHLTPNTALFRVKTLNDLETNKSLTYVIETVELLR